MKIKDPLILGAFAGLTANLGKMLGNVFNKNVLKVSDINYSELAAGIFMTEKELKKPAGLVVGTLADFVIGAIMGIPIVYILRYTGKDHAALKGFGFGNFAWVSLYGAMGRLFGTKSLYPLNAKTNLSAFINHSLFGIIAALIIKKIGDPDLFPNLEPRDDNT